jgi:superfamily II DNA or RNA helicase
MVERNMKLRPYQDTAVAGIRAAWDAGKRCPLLVAPTGAGKTEMAKALLSPFRSPCVIVHTDVLFEQTARRIPMARVYTVQSLVAAGSSGDLRRAGLARHDACFIDEAHHIASDSWRQALPHLEHMSRFGATATPKRADGTPLGDIFDDLVVAAKYSELVAGGFLVRCDVWSPDIGRKRQKKEKVRPDGVTAYLEHGRRDDGSWRPGIHFELTIEACESADGRYREAGIRSAIVCKDTGSRERRSVFDAYSAGDLDMLCSPTALAEGFDSPRAEVCVLRRSCDHVGDWIQRVGRVLRPSPGKDRALLIDCCDTRSKHGLPTDDRSYYLHGAGIEAEKPPTEEPWLPEEDEEEVRVRVAFEAVEARYTIIRDTLLARYQALVQEAADLGYKPGWAFNRFREQTGIEMPHAFYAKFKSICKACSKRLNVGDAIFWMGPNHVEHQECWIRKLDGERLDGVEAALEAGGQ